LISIFLAFFSLTFTFLTSISLVFISLTFTSLTPIFLAFTFSILYTFTSQLSLLKNQEKIIQLIELTLVFIIFIKPKIYKKKNEKIFKKKILNLLLKMK